MGAAVMPGAKEKDGLFCCHPHRCVLIPRIPVGVGEVALLQVGHMLGTVFVPKWRTLRLFPHDPFPALTEALWSLPQGVPAGRVM